MYTDIKLDDSGNFLAAENGDFKLVDGLEGMKQEIKHEFETNKGDLFYDEEYGLSLIDFKNITVSELVQIELSERIRTSLTNKEYINPDSIVIKLHTGLDYIKATASVKTVDDQSISIGIDVNDMVKVVVV